MDHIVVMNIICGQRMHSYMYGCFAVLRKLRMLGVYITFDGCCALVNNEETWFYRSFLLCHLFLPNLFAPVSSKSGLCVLSLICLVVTSFIFIAVYTSFVFICLIWLYSLPWFTFFLTAFFDSIILTFSFLAPLEFWAMNVEMELGA